VPGRASADLALPSTPCANRSRASAPGPPSAAPSCASRGTSGGGSRA